MKPLLPVVLPALLAATLFAVPSSARERDRIPAVTPTGPALSCVPLRAIRESIVRSDSVIDFSTGGRRGYRVTLDAPCPGLGFERAFSYATSLSQLCRQDIITVLRQAPQLTPGASCGLAPFQPVEFVDERRRQRR